MYMRFFGLHFRKAFYFQRVDIDAVDNKGRTLEEIVGKLEEVERKDKSRRRLAGRCLREEVLGKLKEVVS